MVKTHSGSHTVRSGFTLVSPVTLRSPAVGDDHFIEQSPSASLYTRLPDLFSREDLDAPAFYSYPTVYFEPKVPVCDDEGTFSVEETFPSPNSNDMLAKVYRIKATELGDPKVNDSGQSQHAVVSLDEPEPLDHTTAIEGNNNEAEQIVEPGLNGKNNGKNVNLNEQHKECGLALKYSTKLLCESILYAPGVDVNKVLKLSASTPAPSKADAHQQRPKANKVPDRSSQPKPSMIALGIGIDGLRPAASGRRRKKEPELNLSEGDVNERCKADLTFLKENVRVISASESNSSGSQAPNQDGVANDFGANGEHKNLGNKQGGDGRESEQNRRHQEAKQEGGGNSHINHNAPLLRLSIHPIENRDHSAHGPSNPRHDSEVWPVRRKKPPDRLRLTELTLANDGIRSKSMLSPVAHLDIETPRSPHIEQLLLPQQEVPPPPEEIKEPGVHTRPIPFESCPVLGFGTSLQSKSILMDVGLEPADNREIDLVHFGVTEGIEFDLPVIELEEDYMCPVQSIN